MKQKSIITLVVILLIAGAISYGIIWWRKKPKAATVPVDPTAGSSGSSTVINTGTPALPKVQTYAWWINKVGHAKFPLGMSSIGVEVLKVQEVLNQKSVAKSLPKITEDGIWGFNTDTRFKLLFPGFSTVTQFLFITDFDLNKEILN